MTYKDMLEIVKLLSEQHLTGKEIMRKVGCTRNQFYRLKDNLRTMGIKIIYDPSTFGYSLNNNTILTESEALVLNRLNRLFINQREFDTIAQKLNRFKVYPKTDIVFSKKKIRFIVISDLHAGSEFYRPDILRHAAENAKRLDVDLILNAGDTVEGINRERPEQIFELDHENGMGITEQAKYVGREFAQFGDLKVYSIEARGSHGGWSVREQNLDIGDLLSDKASPSYVFVGYDEADIKINGITIRLRHPEMKDLGSYVRDLMPNDKPHILIQGHYHDKVNYEVHRNVHCLNAGCMQSQTPFLRRKGSNPVLGYWIVEVEIGDTPSTTGQTLLKNGNYVESFTATFVPFYDQGNVVEISMEAESR